MARKLPLNTRKKLRRKRLREMAEAGNKRVGNLNALKGAAAVRESRRR